MHMPERNSSMNQCVNEMTPLKVSDTTDSVKHPGVIVECRGSGKWVAKIWHPICKVWVYLGTYSTSEEAGDVCAQKKLDYVSPSVQEEAASLHTDVADFEKHPGIRLTKSGKWRAVIKHNKVAVSLGVYDTPNEAVTAYNLSKLELGSKLISCSRKERGSVYQDKSGKWKAEIQKGYVRYKLGTYATAEGAREALHRKKSELGLKVEDAQESISQKKSGKWEARIKHNKVRLQLGSYDTANEAADAYNLSKLELDSQKLVCSGKAGAVYSTESGTLKAADNRPVKADVEQSVKLHRPRHAYREKVGRWRTEIRHPIIKGKRIHFGGFDTAEEAANAYYSISHDFELMFPGYKKIKQSNNSCQAEAFAEGNSDSICVSGDPQAEEAYNNKMHEVNLIVRAHRKRTQSKGSCEAATVVEGTSHSTCISGDPSVSTRVHLGTCTEEAYNNAMHEFDLMERKQSKEEAASLCTDVADFEKHPGIKLMKSGKWRAVIKHNKVAVSLGMYDTPNEAVTAYNMSKLELGSKLISCSRKERGSVYQDKSGKWKAEIQKGNVRYKLGTYATAEGAREALNRKKCELGLKEEDAQEAISRKKCEIGWEDNAEQSEKNKRRCYAYLKHSGRWKSEIENPISKARVYLGTFDTAEEAEEAYNNKRHEFDLMEHSHKCKMSNHGCEAPATEEHEGDPFVSTDVFVAEARGELDLGIVNSYGQLVGEYSRLDDELWLC